MTNSFITFQLISDISLLILILLVSYRLDLVHKLIDLKIKLSEIKHDLEKH